MGKIKESGWVGWDRWWCYFWSQRWKNYEQDQTIRSCFLSSYVLAHPSFWNLFIIATLCLLHHTVLHRNQFCLCLVMRRFCFYHAIVWWIIPMSSSNSESCRWHRTAPDNTGSHHLFPWYLWKDKSMFPSLKGIHRHHLPTRILWGGELCIG